MDCIPYLIQLSPRPAASKDTGIYPMLPQELQVFLELSSYQAKKETLRVLAELSEKSSFGKIAKAVRSVILHGVRDSNSIVAMFNGPNSDIMDSAPMVLPASVPEMPSVKPNLSGCDHMLFKEDKGCERLRLSRNIGAICNQMEANSHQEYLLKILQHKLAYRETAHRNRLIKQAGCQWPFENPLFWP